MEQKWPERLQQWLDEFGWTPADLIRKSGVSRDNVYKYLKGRVASPRGEILEQLAAAFGRAASELRYGVQGSAHAQRMPLLTMEDVGTITPLGTIRDTWGGRTVPAPLEAGGNAFLVEVEDDGCAPVIRKGDRAMCDPDQPAEPGRYVVARIDGRRAGTIRKYRPLSALDDTKFMLVPTNEDYPTLEVGSDLRGEVVGLVVEVIKKV